MMSKDFTQGDWELVGLSGTGGPYAIRMSFDGDRTYYGVTGIHREPDAQLIKAAPEMYKTLDAIIGKAHDTNAAPHQILKDIVDMAMKAMGEAKGK